MATIRQDLGRNRHARLLAANPTTEVFPTIDSDNGEVLAEVAGGYMEDIHRAIAAAQHTLDYVTP